MKFLKKLSKKTKAVISVIMVVIILITSYAFVIPASAGDSLDYVEKVKSQKIESNSSYDILELVPEENSSTAQYYVNGDNSNFNWNLLSTMTDKATRSGFINSVVGKMGNLISDTNDTPLKNVSYDENYPWSSTTYDNKVNLTYSGGDARYETVSGVKGRLDESDTNDGNYNVEYGYGYCGTGGEYDANPDAYLYNGYYETENLLVSYIADSSSGWTKQSDGTYLRSDITKYGITAKYDPSTDLFTVKGTVDAAKLTEDELLSKCFFDLIKINRVNSDGSAYTISCTEYNETVKTGGMDITAYLYGNPSVSSYDENSVNMSDMSLDGSSKWTNVIHLYNNEKGAVNQRVSVDTDKIGLKFSVYFEDPSSTNVNQIDCSFRLKLEKEEETGFTVNSTISEDIIYSKIKSDSKWSLQADGTYVCTDVSKYGINVAYDPETELFSIRGTVNSNGFANDSICFLDLLKFKIDNTDGSTYTLSSTYYNDITAPEGGMAVVSYFYKNPNVLSSYVHSANMSNMEFSGSAYWTNVSDIYTNQKGASNQQVSYNSNTVALKFSVYYDNPPESAECKIDCSFKLKLTKNASNTEEKNYYASLEFEKIADGVIPENGTKIYQQVGSHYRYCGTIGSGFLMTDNGIYYTVKTVKSVAEKWSTSTPYRIAYDNNIERKEADKYTEKTSSTPGAFNHTAMSLIYVGDGTGNCGFTTSVTGDSWDISTNVIYCTDFYESTDWFKKQVFECSGSELNDLNVTVNTVTPEKLNEMADNILLYDMIIISAGLSFVKDNEAVDGYIPTYTTDISEDVKDELLYAINKYDVPTVVDTGLIPGTCTQLNDLLSGLNNNILTIKNYSGETISGGSTSWLSYNIDKGENGINIYGHHATGTTSNEFTTMIPLWVNLEKGKSYTVSFTSTNKITEFYLFKDGSSACRSSFSMGNPAYVTTNSDGTYTFSRTFVMGENLHTDCTWANYSDCSGAYQVRLDQNAANGSAADDYQVTDFFISGIDLGSETISQAIVANFSGDTYTAENDSYKFTTSKTAGNSFKVAGKIKATSGYVNIDPGFNIDLEYGKTYTMTFKPSTGLINSGCSIYGFYLIGRADPWCHRSLFAKASDAWVQLGDGLYSYTFTVGDVCESGNDSDRSWHNDQNKTYAQTTPVRTYYLRFDINGITRSFDFEISDVAIYETESIETTAGVSNNVYFFSTADTLNTKSFATENFSKSLSTYCLGANGAYSEVVEEIEYENSLRGIKGIDLVTDTVSIASCIRCIINYPGRKSVYNKTEINVLDIEPYSNAVAGITKEQVNAMLPEGYRFDEDKITIKTMAAAEYVGNIENIVENYDLVYIGTSTDNMNTKTNEDGKQVPNYNDDSMDGMYYTNIGDVYNCVCGMHQYDSRTTPVLGGLLWRDYNNRDSDNSRQVKASDWYRTSNWYYDDEDYYTVDARSSGNDLTPTKLKELTEAANSDVPIILSEDLFYQDYSADVSLNIEVKNEDYVTGGVRLIATLDGCNKLTALGITPVFQWYFRAGSLTDSSKDTRISDEFVVSLSTNQSFMVDLTQSTGYYYCKVTFVSSVYKYKNLKDYTIYSNAIAKCTNVPLLKVYSHIGDTSISNATMWIDAQRLTGFNWNTSTNSCSDYTYTSVYDYNSFPTPADGSLEKLLFGSDVYSTSGWNYEYAQRKKNWLEQKYWHEVEQEPDTGFNHCDFTAYFTALYDYGEYAHLDWAKAHFEVTHNNVLEQSTTTRLIDRANLTVYNDTTNRTTTAIYYGYACAPAKIVSGDFGKVVTISNVRSIDTSCIDNASYWYDFIIQGYSGKDSYKNIMSYNEAVERQDLVYKYINLSSPSIEIDPDSVREYDETISHNESSSDYSKHVLTDNTLSCKFTITNPTDSRTTLTRYYCNLYIDSNADGVYSDKEKITNLSFYRIQDGKRGDIVPSGQLRTTTTDETYTYELSKLLPDTYTGCIPWKIEIVQVGNTDAHDSYTGYAYIKPQEITTINVIQIMPMNKVLPEDVDTISENPNSLTKSDNPFYNEVFKNISGVTATEKDDNRIEFKVYDDFNIIVDTVYLNSFYNSLIKSTDYQNEIYNYDMMVVGFGNEYCDGITEDWSTTINNFIKSGKPVLYTHDTTTYYNSFAANTDEMEDNGYFLNEYVRSEVGLDRYGSAYAISRMFKDGYVALTSVTDDDNWGWTDVKLTEKPSNWTESYDWANNSNSDHSQYEYYSSQDNTYYMLSAYEDFNQRDHYRKGYSLNSDSDTVYYKRTFSLVNIKPDNWDIDYLNYATKNSDGEYTYITGDCPTFVANTYYKAVYTKMEAGELFVAGDVYTKESCIGGSVDGWTGRQDSALFAHSDLKNVGDGLYYVTTTTQTGEHVDLTASAMLKNGYAVSYKINGAKADDSVDINYVQGFTRHTLVRFAMPGIHGGATGTNMSDERISYYDSIMTPTNSESDYLRPTKNGVYVNDKTVYNDVTPVLSLFSSSDNGLDSEDYLQHRDTNITTTKITQVNKGQITTYPFNINTNKFDSTVESDTITVAATHEQYYQLNVNDPDVRCWYCLGGSFSDVYNDCVNCYYIYSKNNVIYTGAGNSTDFSEAEAKLFLNTMITSYAFSVVPPSAQFRNENDTKEQKYEVLSEKQLESTDNDYVYFKVYDENVDDNFYTASVKFDFSVGTEEMNTIDATNLTVEYKDGDNWVTCDTGSEDYTVYVNSLCRIKIPQELKDKLTATAENSTGYANEEVSIGLTPSAKDASKTEHTGEKTTITLQRLEYLSLS